MDGRLELLHWAAQREFDLLAVVPAGGGRRRLMPILLVSDAWAPQVNGVVRTLQRVRQECEVLGREVEVVSPDQFRTVPCPTYPEIRLALRPGRRGVVAGAFCGHDGAMATDPLPARNADDIAAELWRLSPDYAPTPLLNLERLARRAGVAQVLAKDEGRRMLGSFKSLGGTYAGLRALARAAGTDVAGLLDPVRRPRGLPALVCASDGNHGLAVAAAARFAGAPARIFLHATVAAARARRIEAEGAEIAWIEGTYDDAVNAAAAAARSGAGILVADTTDEPGEPVVADVMAGYGVIAAEIRRQVAETGHPRPTHLFVQAGVGGLAAAMAAGLQAWLAPPAAVVVVEPEAAACVTAALAAGRPVQLPGELETAAGMLSCGVASAPALATLRRHGARAVSVSEAVLMDAVQLLRAEGGPAATPSGAASLAGLMSIVAAGSAGSYGLNAASRVLITVTEADLAEA